MGMLINTRGEMNVTKYEGFNPRSSGVSSTNDVRRNPALNEKNHPSKIIKKRIHSEIMNDIYLYPLAIVFLPL